MARRFFIFSLIPLAILFAGCTNGGQTTQKWFYRYTNAVADVSGTDLIADKVPATTNVLYGDSWPNPDYQESDFTNQNPNIFFDVLETGTSNFLDSIVVEKMRDQSVHLFALGLKSPASQQPPARLVPVTVVRNLPNGNNARLVFVHGYVRMAGTQSPQVDLMRAGQTEPLIPAVDFAGSQTITIAAGTYDLSVRIAGLMSGTFLTRPGTTFAAGRIYILLLRGVEGMSGGLAPTLDVFEDPVRNP